MRDEDEDRELRRIAFRQKRGVSTWQDDTRANEIRRRQVDREFEEQEAAREPVRQLQRMQERSRNGKTN